MFNLGGVYCLKYGMILNYVFGMCIVFCMGEVVSVGGLSIE